MLLNMGVSQNYFRGPQNKDDNILGSILGSPNFLGNYRTEVPRVCQDMSGL